VKIGNENWILLLFLHTHLDRMVCCYHLLHIVGNLV